jgi:phospholipid-binding lipoprotein MlaA
MLLRHSIAQLGLVFTALLVLCCFFYSINPAYSAANINSSGSTNYKNFYDCLYDQYDIYDPFEKFNRKVYPFSLAIDEIIVYPTTTAYRTLLPAQLRLKINNFFNNMLEPRNAINALLQGKNSSFVVSLWRLAFNSVIGVFGIFDVATKLHVKSEPSTFQETLHFYGFRRSPYIVAPFFGVYPLVGLVGELLDSVTNPAFYVTSPFSSLLYSLNLLRIWDSYFDIKRNIQLNSLDSYTKFRNIHEQLLQNKCNTLDFN